MSYLVVLNRAGEPVDAKDTGMLVLDMLRLRRNNNELPPSKQRGPHIPLSRVACDTLKVCCFFMYKASNLPVSMFAPFLSLRLIVHVSLHDV